jgi:hypothetical protein
VKDLPEGPDLFRRHVAVGLGHLGAEHDRGDAEGGLPRGLGRGGTPARTHPVEGVAGGRADERAQRAAEGEAGGPAKNLAPNAHASRTLTPSLCSCRMLMPA